MSEQQLINRLSEIVEPSNLELDALDAYTHDEFASEEFNCTPLAVVKPTSEQQLAQTVKLCAQQGISVTARGGGTGLSAACVPAEGGIVLSLERLNSIVEMDKKNHTITAQAGVPLSARKDRAGGDSDRFCQKPEMAGIGFERELRAQRTSNNTRRLIS